MSWKVLAESPLGCQQMIFRPTPPKDAEVLRVLCTLSAHGASVSVCFPSVTLSPPYCVQCRFTCMRFSPQPFNGTATCADWELLTRVLGLRLGHQISARKKIHPQNSSTNLFSLSKLQHECRWVHQVNMQMLQISEHFRLGMSNLPRRLYGEGQEYVHKTPSLHRPRQKYDKDPPHTQSLTLKTNGLPRLRSGAFKPTISATPSDVGL